MDKRIKWGEMEACQGPLALEKGVVSLIITLEGHQAICMHLTCVLWMTSTMACLSHDITLGQVCTSVHWCVLVCTAVHLSSGGRTGVQGQLGPQS